MWTKGWNALTLSRSFLYIQEWASPMTAAMLHVQGGLRPVLCRKCPSTAREAQAAPTWCHHPHSLAFNNAPFLWEWPLSCKKITQTTQNEVLLSKDSVYMIYCGKIQQGSYIQCWMEHGHRCWSSEATSRFTCYLYPSSFLLKLLLYQTICCRPSSLSSRKHPGLWCRAFSITLRELHLKYCFIQNVALH